MYNMRSQQRKLQSKVRQDRVAVDVDWSWWRTEGRIKLRHNINDDLQVI